MCCIFIEILADMLDEDRRHQIKQKVVILNSMLKKMIPLYGPQGIRRPDESTGQDRGQTTIKVEPAHHHPAQPVTRTLFVVKEESAD